MKRITSIPIASQIIAGAMLSSTWQKWMLQLGSYVKEGTNQSSIGKVSYYMAGSICHISITESGTHNLPYSIESSKYISVYVDGTRQDVLISAGANSVTIPSGGTILVSDWYIAKLST